jgi:hypothetical protein
LLVGGLLFQSLVGRYGECCGVDANLSKRLQFWSHELRASIPPMNNSEKIAAVSDFVFQKLFLSPNPRHSIVDWGQAMQERKCHPFMLAVLYGYFCEAAELKCSILNDCSFRLVKFLDDGASSIFDLQSKGSPVSSSQLLECLKNKCGQKTLDPMSENELKKIFYIEILKGHFAKENWNQVLVTLKLREEDGLGSPRDYSTYAHVFEKLGRKDEALNYIKRFFAFAPHLPADLTEKYHELHFDQIESILSKMELHPFEN